MLLELDRVTSGYGRSPVLHDVSLAVAAGEIVALIGANGAGKSTLLNTVMGLVAASSGAIRFDDAPITRPVHAGDRARRHRAGARAAPVVRRDVGRGKSADGRLH